MQFGGRQVNPAPINIAFRVIQSKCPRAYDGAVDHMALEIIFRKQCGARAGRRVDCVTRLKMCKDRHLLPVQGNLEVIRKAYPIPMPIIRRRLNDDADRAPGMPRRSIHAAHFGQGDDPRPNGQNEIGVVCTHRLNAVRRPAQAARQLRRPELDMNHAAMRW